MSLFVLLLNKYLHITKRGSAPDKFLYSGYLPTIKEINVDIQSSFEISLYYWD